MEKLDEDHRRFYELISKTYTKEDRVWVPKKIKSEFILNELRKRKYSSVHDRSYLDDLFDIEYWIINGPINMTHHGLNIPYFSNHHPEQLIDKYRLEFYKIFSDITRKDSNEANEWRKCMPYLRAEVQKKLNMWWKTEDYREYVKEDRIWLEKSDAGRDAQIAIWEKITKERWLKHGGKL